MATFVLIAKRRISGELHEFSFGCDTSEFVWLGAVKSRFFSSFHSRYFLFFFFVFIGFDWDLIGKSVYAAVATIEPSIWTKTEQYRTRTARSENIERRRRTRKSWNESWERLKTRKNRFATVDFRLMKFRLIRVRLRNVRVAGPLLQVGGFPQSAIFFFSAEICEYTHTHTVLSCETTSR